MKRSIITGSIIVIAAIAIGGCGQETKVIQKDTVVQQSTSSQETETKDTAEAFLETEGKPETEKESQPTSEAVTAKETNPAEETLSETQIAAVPAPDTGNIQDTAADTNGTIQTDTTVQPDYNQDTSYTVIDVNYQEGAVNVHYPQIQGLTETEVESKWNDTIKNDIFGEIEALSTNSTYNCQFEITTQVEDMLSIVISGDAYAQGAAHPYNFVKTYNIDFNSGEAIKLTDIADVEQIAGDIIEGKGYETLEIDKEDFDADVKALNYTNESLVSQLQGGSFYQKEGKIILIIGVSHAAGDYAKVKLE